LHDRVQLDLEPVLEHPEVSASWPRRLVSVPPIKFVLEDRRMHLLENLPRRLVVLVAWNQIYSLLGVRIGHDPRIVETSRPVKVGLLWPHYHDTAVEHRCALRLRSNGLRLSGARQRVRLGRELSPARGGQNCQPPGPRTAPQTRPLSK